MKLNLREIIENPGSELPFDCLLSGDNLDFPSIVRYESAPRATGRIYNEAGVLRLEGEIRSDMVCICDRCAAEFPTVKTMPLSAVIVDENDDNADDPELFFLDGNEIDLDGKNLNLGPCGCGKEIDPRFAVLEQLLDT